VSVQSSIATKLQAALFPSHLEVVNESHMHNVPVGSETHFKVVVVSARFEGLASVKRHQLVYGALADELKAGVHALAITSRSPAEWAADATGNASPQCLGGGAAKKSSSG
jgi:stress-induced morphogen